MLTLHTATEWTKKFFIYGVLAIIGILLLWGALRLGGVIKDALFPKKVNPPNVLFGKLPPLIFPKSVTDQKLSYVIETLSGQLPTFTNASKSAIDRIPVYKVAHTDLSLLDLQNARERVQRFAPIRFERHIGENLYQWITNEVLPKTIDMNIVSQDFRMTSSFVATPSSFPKGEFETASEAVGRSHSLFSTLAFMPEEIDRERTRTTLLAIQNGRVVEVKDLIDAQIIQVDFFQKPKGKEKYPMYYPYPPHSTINAFVASDDAISHIVEAHFTYHIATDTSATYPVKTAMQAFEELKMGKGYIAKWDGSKHIKIRDAFLGYYMSNEPQDYLIPIVVFVSDGDSFYAYVPAIPDTWFR